MIKEVLKEKETIAYLSLKNDLNNGHLAHSYLLYGELNPLKKDTAFLLAQSIIEDKNDFACEECDTCKRIKEGKYFDVIYIDGYKETIKKEHIERIMDEFSKTSLEASNKKIYIINNINNATSKVLNMILKFMEEPSSSETYGIFISDNIDTLLETVVSRCQKIPFTTRDFSYLINEYKNKGYSDIDAYLLSSIKHEMVEINEEAYLAGKEYVYKTIDNLRNKKYIPVLFSREFYRSVEKDNLKEASDYYLDIMIKIIEDSIADCDLIDEDYQAYMQELKEFDIARLLDIMLEAKSKAIIPVSRTLLFDQIASKIIS